jgi:stearoyl-CoA desaturase (delta-9 desaturase)
MATTLFFFCHLCITMGPHRFWTHQTHNAMTRLRAVYIIGFSAVMQNSAWWWSGKHLCHHAYSDTERDPYTVLHGFWWAHMGWLLRGRDDLPEEGYHRFARDPLLVWQHTHNRKIGIPTALVFPMAIATLWGDALGGLLVGGFMRLCIQYHATWCINSVAHYFGPWRYSKHITARTCYWVLAFTVGEWNHEGHHHFENDYRLGNVRWYDIDPGKWAIWLCSKVGLASDLRRTALPST